MSERIEEQVDHALSVVRRHLGEAWEKASDDPRTVYHLTASVQGLTRAVELLAARERV